MPNNNFLPTVIGIVVALVITGLVASFVPEPFKSVLIVGCVVGLALYAVMAWVPMPGNFKYVLDAIVCLMFLFWALHHIGVLRRVGL